MVSTVSDEDMIIPLYTHRSDLMRPVNYCCESQDCLKFVRPSAGPGAPEES